MATTLTTSFRYINGDMWGTSKLIIPTADVLTLNGTPVVLTPVPDTGKTLKLLDWSIQTTSGTAYLVNTGLVIYTDTATVEQGYSADALLTVTTARIVNGLIVPTTALSTAGTQLISAKALKVKTLTGNPTTGTADITIYASWREIS